MDAVYDRKIIDPKRRADAEFDIPPQLIEEELPTIARMGRLTPPEAFQCANGMAALYRRWFLSDLDRCFAVAEDLRNWEFADIPTIGQCLRIEFKDKEDDIGLGVPGVRCDVARRVARRAPSPEPGNENQFSAVETLPHRLRQTSGALSGISVGSALCRAAARGTCPLARHGGNTSPARQRGSPDPAAKSDGPMAPGLRGPRRGGSCWAAHCDVAECATFRPTLPLPCRLPLSLPRNIGAPRHSRARQRGSYREEAQGFRCPLDAATLRRAGLPPLQFALNLRSHKHLRTLSFCARPRWLPDRWQPGE